MRNGTRWQTMESALHKESVIFVAHPVEGQSEDGRDGKLESVFSIPSSPLHPNILSLFSVFLRIFVLRNDTISMQMMHGRTRTHGGAGPNQPPSLPPSPDPPRGG